jgi:hypothetical protein
MVRASDAVDAVKKIPEAVQSRDRRDSRLKLMLIASCPIEKFGALLIVAWNRYKCLRGNGTKS